ncbi:MAG TPA: acyl carrier protein [Micromonospora sp.]
MTTSEPERPGDPVAEVVTAAWATVLRVERLTPADNFFRLGGDSLVAARLAAQLRTALEVRVPMGAVFEYPNLGEFVAALRAEYGPGLDEAAELYLSVLSCSDADAEAMLGGADE